MKKLTPLILICLLCTSFALKAQQKETIIQGRLTNSPERMLKIFFLDQHGRQTIDTIHLDEQGAFYFKTKKIVAPQRTSLQQNKTQINQIYIAPGYRLTITGDATDYKTLFATKNITGYGAAANQYRLMLDKAYAQRSKEKPWYEMNLDELKTWIKSEKELQDSVHHAVFTVKPKNDPYFSTFAKMINIDNESLRLYRLADHLSAPKYSYNERNQILSENMPASFAAGVSNDEYLISQDYKDWLLSVYLRYKRGMDKLQDSTAAKKPGYGLNSIKETYKGKVLDFYLYKAIGATIDGSKNIAELNLANTKMQPYIATIANKEYRNDLNQLSINKEKQLLQVQVGQPAPAFELQSDDGKIYKLADFKGKVLYIDLWASWCKPCRNAMPDYKKLYEKHKDSGKIAFVGVAVSDGEKEWRQALKEEMPQWLQLYDKDGFMSKQYIANAIPKYIVIDKNGKIVSFDAPGPAAEAAEKLLLEEASKG